MKLLYAIHHIDVLVFTRILNVQLQMPLQRISRVVSKTADGPLYVIATLWVALQEGVSHPFVTITLTAFLIERCLYYVLKNSLRRNRPQAALANFKSFIVPQDQFSFPSGHTSAAFLMASLGAAFFPPLMLFLYCWAMLVGVSRIMLGVHFPTDILVGSILGMSIANVCLNLV